MNNIDMVCGFFESGKTTFIKEFIKKEVCTVYDRILIINCEYGMETYEKFKVDGVEIKIVDIYDRNEFKKEKIEKEIADFHPEYILVEYNGTWEIQDFIKEINIRNFVLKNLITVIDYNSFDIYIKNMEKIISDKILNSDIVVFTKNKGHNVDDMNRKISLIRKLNKGCDIFYSEELFIEEEADIIDKAVSKSDAEIIKFGVFFVLFYIFMIGIKNIFPDFYAGKFQKISVIFLSLLIEILPFIILGSVVSSIIMILIPQRKLDAVFKRGGVKSILISLFAGIFFPVCDCAMVPIANSIVKKGYSVPVAITFLLASPAVNPIVIMSTYYAFSGDLKIVGLRVFFGLLIAFLTGVTLELYFKIKKVAVLKDFYDVQTMSAYTGTTYESDSKSRGMNAVFAHTKQELYRTGFYVILGAMLSAVIQVMIPKSVFYQFSQVNSIAVFVMIFAGFFISVCSTSNAFIARSFYSVMPFNSILAFLVMGPLIDITNITVLSTTFKNKFIFKLVGFMLYISFIIFSVVIFI